MVDYIDRQAALHYIADWQYGEAKVGNEAVYDTIENCYKMIEQLPSVQPNLQPTCNQLATDCVERRAAVDAVANGLKNVFVEYQDVAEKLLNNVPSVQPQRWIPIKWHACTAEDREEYGFGEEISVVFDCDMPSDNQEILVTTSHGYVAQDVCYIDDGLSLDSGHDWIEDITAWMPLPEPWRGGQDETN